MAKRTAQPTMPLWAQALGRYSTLIVPVGLISLLGVIIVPLPPILMDVLIAGNIALAAIVLLTTVYVKSPLDLSVFPSLLLATTLFRLVLNVASTRLILSAEASSPEDVTDVAGEVIEAFGSFVAGGNVVVGSIIFIILIVVQFVVITKGSTRISEVAARFTLDGMPGKQMAIDADLNAGIINEQQAKERREEISRQADFYGAMDGASKFVRGDAIAGIIITVINILGGFAIGLWEKGWDPLATMEAFTKLTIGDGLVSQIPSFIIAIAAGLIVTRSSSQNDLGQELTGQLSSRPVALGITAGFLGLLAFTGLPMLPLLALAGSIGGTAFLLNRKGQVERHEQAAAERAEQVQEEQGPPPVEKLLTVDTMELEVGYGLVRLADPSQGGDIPERITMIRRQLAVELGLIVPPVCIRDNMEFEPNAYRVKIRNNVVAEGKVYPGHYVAIDTGMAAGELNGTPTKEPALGMDAWWIDESEKERAETLNYIVVDASSVMATHLTEVIKSHAEELLTREETNHLLDQLKEKSPKLVEEVVPGAIKPGELQKILQALLRERVPIRDLETILETLSDWAPRTKDPEVLTEYVRNALRRTICSQYAETDPETGDSRLYCVTLDPQLEDMVNGYIERSGQGTTMTMPPAVANRVTGAILTELQKLIETGHHPVVLTSPQVRAQVRNLLETHLPNVAVLGYNEVSKGVEVESLGLVQLETSPRGTEMEGATP
jgi:flagellar biosynthesis protein FlhA